MTSSNYYDIRILVEGREVYHRRLDALELPWAGAEPVALRAEDLFEVRVARSAPEAPRLRLRLGSELIAEAEADSPLAASGPRTWFYNEFGESSVTLEQEVEGTSEEEGEQFTPLFEQRLEVVPRPEVARDFRVMLSDVASIHEGLATDLIGRAFTRRAAGAGKAAARQQPEEVLRHVQGLYARLERALAQIARQPSVLLDRSERLARYRGGDRLDAAALASVVRDPQTRLDAAGRVRSLGKVRVRAPVLSDDLPEHRHTAEGLRRLARRAEQLAEHCERSAQLIAREEERWGRARPGKESVYAQEHQPRVERLEAIASQARRASEGFLDLLHHHAFLRDAKQPRTPLGPTPTFLGRTAYREVYRALVQARQPLGALVEGEEVRLTYRSLSKLYEYWTFLATVTHLRHRLGAPKEWVTLAVVDENYRPDLAPGQEIRFPVGKDQAVVATYEPEIRPWQAALKRGDRWGAALTREPLRPDIAVEVRGPGDRATALVLDAKSTDAFHFDNYRGMTDYARQVFDPRRWQQPVKQVFLLHRDRRAFPVTNVPNYLQGQQINPEVVVHGAVPCVPEQAGRIPDALAAVLDRFLETYLPV